MTTPTTANSLTPSVEPFDPRRFLGVILVAAGLNLVIFALAKMTDAAMTIDSPAYDTISWVMVGLSTFIPLTIAGLVTFFVSRRRPGFRHLAQLLGLGVALISIVGPFAVADDMGTALALAAMHLVVGAAWYLAVAAPSSR